jgi:hypothetical protein
MDKLDFVALPRGDTPGSTAKVWIETGRDKVERDGRVVRLLGDLDGVGRMARLLVEVDDPFDLATKDPKERGMPLLLGAYVRVAVDGVALEGVAEIPRRALREQDKVYALTADNTLSIRTINVVWGTDDTVLVTGPLKNGDRLVTSSLSTPVEGMKLRAAESAKTEAKVEAKP